MVCNVNKNNSSEFNVESDNFCAVSNYDQIMGQGKIISQISGLN